LAREGDDHSRIYVADLSLEQGQLQDVLADLLELRTLEIALTGVGLNEDGAVLRSGVNLNPNPTAKRHTAWLQDEVKALRCCKTATIPTSANRCTAESLT
jgi:hypothetical protein